MNNENDLQWHIDKKVPIALIITLAIQTVTIVWWAATLSTRVEQLERAAVAYAPQVERVIRLEEKIGVVQQGITDIKALVRGIKPP
jgi:hypothetical protein